MARASQDGGDLLCRTRGSSKLKTAPNHITNYNYSFERRIIRAEICTPTIILLGIVKRTFCFQIYIYMLLCFVMTSN